MSKNPYKTVRSCGSPQERCAYLQKKEENVMRKTYGLLLLICILLLTGCKHEHKWVEADCVNPATCADCGATKGEPLGHTWKPATCTTVTTCSFCGETYGEPLEHTASAWEIVETDAVNATCIYMRSCVGCGSTLGKFEADLDSLHDGKYFQFTAEELEKRLEQILTNGWGYGRNCIEDLGSDNEIIFYLTEGDSADPLPSLFIVPMRDFDFLSQFNKDVTCINQIVLAVPDEHLQAAYDIIAALIPACDPSFGSGYRDDPGFIDVYLLMDDLTEKEVKKNGLYYQMRTNGDLAFLLISIDQ